LEELVKKLIPVIILALACSRQESGAEATHSIALKEAPAQSRADVQAATLEAATPAAVAHAPARTPMIVRTADVKIVVSDTARSVSAITAAVEAAGGYVSGSNVWREGELLRAKLTLRVPSAKLTSTLATIRAAAKRVETETVASEDVSQEFVDLESQVRNLEATEEELRELLRVARVNSKKATEVLEVHQQLTVIRGQIEQARGRMRYLSQVTAMSSVALDIAPDAVAQPVIEPGWQPLLDARAASRALIALLQNLATAAIWFVIYLLPILAMLCAAVWMIVKAGKRAKATEV
jgi:hypothetical protein